MSISNPKAMALAALGFSFYSIGDVFIKLAGNFYAPEQIAFFINMFFLPLLLVLSSRVGGLKNTLKTKHLRWHLLRSCFGMICFFMMVNGFSKLGMATSYTLIFAGPFIAAIMSIYFLGNKIGLHRWASIITGFIGVLVVLRPGLVPMEPAALGIILAAFCYAGSTIIMRKIGPEEPLLAFSLYGCLCGTAVFGSIMFLKGEFLIPPPEHLYFFAGTAIFHVFAGFWVSRAFSSADTAAVAPFHYVQLLWGAAFGYLLFNTPIDGWTALGGLIIVGSGIYMIHREHVKHREVTKGIVSHGGSLMMEEELGEQLEQNRNGTTG